MLGPSLVPVHQSDAPTAPFNIHGKSFHGLIAQGAPHDLGDQAAPVYVDEEGDAAATAKTRHGESDLTKGRRPGPKWTKPRIKNPGPVTTCARGELNRKNITLNQPETALVSVKPVSRYLRLPPVTSGACTPRVHQPVFS